MLAAVLVIVLPIISTGMLWLFQKLVDEVFVARQTSALTFFFLAYLSLAIFSFAIDYLDQRLDAAIAEQIAQDTRVALYRHIVTASPGSLGSRNAGELLAYLGGDVEKIASLIYSAPMSLLSNVAKIVCYATFLFLLSWKLTLLALAVVPPLVWLVFKITPKIRTASRSSRRKTTAWMSLAEETLGARPLIHAFNTQAQETGRFAARTDRARQAELITVRLQAGLGVAIGIITTLGSLAIIGLAAYEVSAGRLSVGSVLAFIGAVGFLYGPIRTVSQSAGRFQRASVSAERLRDLLDKPSLVKDSGNSSAVTQRAQGGIEFSNVHFAYPDGKQILHGLSFTTQPGETMAVVGTSGSGKSTLIKLLLRFYEPTSGAIYLDGVDIRELSLVSLRQNIATVLQEPYILQGSIADNIGYGIINPDHGRMQSAAEISYTEPFVSPLLLGYNTQVGPRGEGLSGGQRQRIALARALMRDAPLLVMDEATASVDGETENLIQQALSKMVGQRTLLLVSHRASTLRFADRVLVMEQGNIIETGTADELMRPGTRCHELFETQLTQNQPA
jgi:ABC-type multidrug transport system fused ATPase/permease subunit